MKSTNYSEKVLDHFRNPRNVGTLEGEDVASGRVGNPVCGDIMEMYIQVDEKDHTIKDIKFQTFGCGSAVATSSIITEMAVGKHIDVAMEISRTDVAKNLEGLPPIKMHCSNLAADALQEAIKNYKKSKGIAFEEDTPHTDHATHINDKKETNRGQSTAIKNEMQFLGSGVYYSIENLDKFKDRRVLVLFKNEESAAIAMELTKVTGRVILLTKYQDIQKHVPNLNKELKRSDVKILGESRLLEIMGEGDVEKVKILDLDEESSYELFVDDVIIPEHVEIPKSCDLADE